MKNSGIPGPGAITWKRKSTDDSPKRSKNKKRKIVSDDSDDPYSFDFDDDDPKKSHIGRQSQTNGDTPAYGPLYKKKVLITKDIEYAKSEDDICGIDLNDKHVESDDNSRSSSGNASPLKKKIKRPKIEEWSVKKGSKSVIKDKPVEPAEPVDKADSDMQVDEKEDESSTNSLSKGPVWGFPAVQKTPVKETEIPKPEKPPEVTESTNGSSKSSLNNKWLQAFGAPVVKSKKSGEGKSRKQHLSDDVTEQRTVLDIPPEIRRKPRPNFGGLLHFTSDWTRSVKRHHERCRIPSVIENSAALRPQILASAGPGVGVGEALTVSVNYEEEARKDMVSPPDLLALERQKTEKASIALSTNNVPPMRPTPSLGVSQPEPELSGQLPSIVETILANRKKLREYARLNTSTGRMMRMYKEKKRREKVPKLDTPMGLGSFLGLLPTPGLPLLTEDTKDVLIGSGFGNFRRHTLNKYLGEHGDSDDNKDWHFDILETKTRRQSSLTKPVTSFKEVFGIEPPTNKQIKAANKLAEEVPVSPKKEKKKKVSKKAESISRVEKLAESPHKNNKKFSPKELEVKKKPQIEDEDDGAFSQEVGDPTESDNNLQSELGGFALDLLEDNPSWSKQVTIQNLVIWEPAEDQQQITTGRKKKGKKKRGKKSGLDFQKRKSKGGSSVGGSVPVSRAGSPEPSAGPEGVREVVHTLEQVVSESNRWVVDKNAGETVLHRASKMGYPDVVAYSLESLGPGHGPMDKDYAGLTPLHKAAFKGHDTNVRVLLKYGADASAGVKGTRALHEAIDGCSAPTMRTLLSFGADPLLHDYSGNMPLDLCALADPTSAHLQPYFANILADLHGKLPGKPGQQTTVSPVRWNVSHSPDFHDPNHPESGLDLNNLRASSSSAIETKKPAKDDLDAMFTFECSSHPLPATYQLLDRPGEWVLYKDLKEFTKKRSGSKFDIRSKGDLIEMKKSEFIKTSHSCLLDRRPLEIRYHERTEEDIVILVKIDKFVRKIFNSELVHIPK